MDIIFIFLCFRSRVVLKCNARQSPFTVSPWCLMTSRYVWPNGCHSHACSAKSPRSTDHRHTITSLGRFATPDVRFIMVHIDLVGPLRPSKGFTYLHKSAGSNTNHKLHSGDSLRGIREWLDLSIWHAFHSHH